MNTSRKSSRPDIDTLTDEEKAVFAETLRERIYSTITLLAVLTVMWQHPEEHSVLGVIGVIFGTVGALFFATIIAARMSYRMVHASSELEPKYQEAVHAASGLLAPAVAPTIFVLISITGVIELKTALFIGMCSLILSLFFFSIYAGRKSSDNFSRILLYSLLQTGLGIAVVLLKIAVE